MLQNLCSPNANKHEDELPFECRFNRSIAASEGLVTKHGIKSATANAKSEITVLSLMTIFLPKVNTIKLSAGMPIKTKTRICKSL